MNLFGAIDPLLPWMRTQKVRFSTALFFILLSTATEVLGPILVGRAIDLVGATERPANVLHLCKWIAIGYMVLTLVKFISDTLQAQLLQRGGQQIIHELRRSVFEHLMRLPMNYFDKNATGRLLSRVVNDIKTLGELFTASIAVLGLDVMILIGTIGAMVWLSPAIALATLIPFPLVLLAIHYFGGRLAEAHRGVRASIAELNGFLGEHISGIATIQSHSAEVDRAKAFESVGERNLQAQMEALKVFALVMPLTNLLNGVCMAVLLIAGGQQVLKGALTVGVLVAFIGYMRNLFQPIRDLVEKYNVFLSSMVSAERVANILAEKPEPGRTTSTHQLVGSETQGMAFHDVSFIYPGKDHASLIDVSFSIEPGERVALVGPTGSGKSTIVKLLSRLYEPDKGVISVGGVPITEWDVEHLRRSIGIVQQEIYLFEGTLRDNLTLGRGGADDSRLRDLLDQVGLWDLIDGRGGLDLEIQESGRNLSVGERQLLSLARVLLRNPPILVLDEATAHLDRGTEERVFEATEAALHGRTALIIAHRPATLRNCSRFIRLAEGRIA